MIHQYLTRHLDEISQLCLRYRVSRLYAFGSLVDGRFEAGKSDVDLLVEFDKSELSKKEIARSLLELWIELQELLQCKVDLITTDKIKGDFFKKYLNLYKELIYSKT